MAKTAALDFQPIVSSNLESAAFDGDAIIVRFKNGSTYKYPNCSESVWKEFRTQFDGKKGRSAGKFLNTQLRPRAYDRIEDWN